MLFDPPIRGGVRDIGPVRGACTTVDVKSVFILSCTYGLLLIRYHHVVNKGCRLSPSALIVVPVFAPLSRPVFGLRASAFAHHLLRPLKVEDSEDASILASTTEPSPQHQKTYRASCHRAKRRSRWWSARRCRTPRRSA